MSAYFESGLTVGELSWHGQEVNIPANDDRRYSVDDCMELSGMNNQIFESPVYLPGMTSDPIEGYKAICERMADNTIVTHGIMGDRYHALQTKELFQWFQPWLDTREVSIETCGRLKGGSQVWVMAKLQRSPMVVTTGDTVEKFLLLSSSHNGTLATQVGFNPTRVVCWNTLSLALGEQAQSKQLRKVKHTANQLTKLADIRETINLIDQQFETQASYWRMMANRKIEIQSVGEYVAKVFGYAENANDWSTRTKNQFDHILNLCLRGIGQDGKATVWGAYNGVTQFLSHEYGNSAENRLAANWFGPAATTNEKALQLAMQLAS